MPKARPGLLPRGARRTFRIAGIVALSLLLGTCSEAPSVLHQIRALGVLKVVTRNSPTAYYLGVRGPAGPEYELASGFARQLGVRAEFAIATSGAAALAEVMYNRAHLAAAGIVATDHRRATMAFGPVYQRVRQHVVQHAKGRVATSLEDLRGKAVEVIARSTHAVSLRSAAAADPALQFREVTGVDQLDLFARVSSRAIDFTVADSTEFSLGRHFHPDLRVAFDLEESEEIAWALRANDASLEPLVQRYFEQIEADGTLAEILGRYYSTARKFDYVQSLNFVRDLHERLPNLRDFFEEAAADTGFDWRLLAAIGYQESKWDADAVSMTGVRGIMMLTEDTAARVGVLDRLDPRASILGGARYLIEVRDKIPVRVAEPDRTWLALAGYNVGFGHLEDARILTQRHGGNPDLWNDVRTHLPKLAQERWYTQTRRGYARGWEPVTFVENIRQYLEVLVWMTGDPDADLRLMAESPATVVPGGSD